MNNRDAPGPIHGQPDALLRTRISTDSDQQCNEAPIGPNLDPTAPPPAPVPILPVLFETFVDRALEFASMENFSQWVERKLGKESYGAPRVFDLFTLLAITLAFAMLFTFMRLLSPLLGNNDGAVTIVISLFVSFIAIGQMLLCGGKRPRIASIATGPIAWQALGIGIAFWMIPKQEVSTFLVTTFSFVTCSSTLGFFAGYLGGAAVAGVFLIADFLRKRYMQEAEPKKDSSLETMWETDDIENNSHESDS